MIQQIKFAIIWAFRGRSKSELPYRHQMFRKLALKGKYEGLPSPSFFNEDRIVEITEKEDLIHYWINTTCSCAACRLSARPRKYGRVLYSSDPETRKRIHENEDRIIAKGCTYKKSILRRFYDYLYDK